MNVPSIRALLTLALVVTASSASPARAATAPAVRWRGQGCVESVVKVAIPLETAQRQLPPGYRARSVGATGRGQLSLGVVRCRALQVNGVEQSSDVISDAGISIHPVPGLPGVTYHLWQVVGTGGFRQRLARLGLPGAAVGNATSSVTATPAGQHGTATVPWVGGSDYTLDVAGTQRGETPSAGWTYVHLGPRGRVRTVYRFGAAGRYSGLGTLRTSAGTPLAAMLGAPAAPTNALTGHVYEPFDIEANVYLDR